IGDVVALLALGLCVTDIVNVEGQRRGQVVEPVQFELVLHIHILTIQKILKQGTRTAAIPLEEMLSSIPPGAEAGTGFISGRGKSLYSKNLLLLLLLIVSQVVMRPRHTAFSQPTYKIQ